MTQERRDRIKESWFRGCENIREIRMPSEARFFVGQEVVEGDDVYEVIGYYDYFGKSPMYLTWQKTGKYASHVVGIPMHLQKEMYLLSEAHLHRKARIIRMDSYRRIY